MDATLVISLTLIQISEIMDLYLAINYHLSLTSITTCMKGQNKFKQSQK